MTRTHEKVGRSPQSKPASRAPAYPPPYSSATAPLAVKDALAIIEGRWKLEILFSLFGGEVRRFSELERAISGVSQKMLAQQLRQLEEAGVVTRKVYPEVPPKVEYALTDWGQSLCPVLDALLKWHVSGSEGEGEDGGETA